MVLYDAVSISKFAKPETSKTHNKGFKEGLEQIALAVNGNDPAPILDDDQAVIIFKTIRWSFIKY